MNTTKVEVAIHITDYTSFIMNRRFTTKFALPLKDKFN